MKQSFRQPQVIVNTIVTIDTTEKVETIGTLVRHNRLTSLRGALIRKNGYGSFRIVSEPHSKTRGRYPQTVVDHSLVHPSTSNKESEQI